MAIVWTVKRTVNEKVFLGAVVKSKNIPIRVSHALGTLYQNFEFVACAEVSPGPRLSEVLTFRPTSNFAGITPIAELMLCYWCYWCCVCVMFSVMLCWHRLIQIPTRNGEQYYLLSQNQCYVWLIISSFFSTCYARSIKLNGFRVLYTLFTMPKGRFFSSEAENYWTCTFQIAEICSFKTTNVELLDLFYNKVEIYGW